MAPCIPRAGPGVFCQDAVMDDTLGDLPGLFSRRRKQKERMGAGRGVHGCEDRRVQRGDAERDPALRPPSCFPFRSPRPVPPGSGGPAPLARDSDPVMGAAPLARDCIRLPSPLKYEQKENPLGKEGKSLSSLCLGVAVFRTLTSFLSVAWGAS